MSTIFESTKVFTAVAVLFAVATAASAGNFEVRTGLTFASEDSLIAKHGPTLPPPDEEGK